MRGGVPPGVEELRQLKSLVSRLSEDVGGYFLLQEASAARNELLATAREIVKVLGSEDLESQDPLVEAPVLYSVGSGSDPVDFLRKHYGEYLSFFGAPRNRIAQFHLRKLDPGLYRALANRMSYLKRKNKTNLLLGDIIPSKEVFLAENTPQCPEDLKRKS